MECTIDWGGKDGMLFVARTGSGHVTAMDGAPEGGGNNLAPRPMEMLLTGETIEATEAREFGLVNRVVPPEYLNQIVNKYAEAIASKSSLTVKIGKEAFYQQAEMNLADAYDYTARVMVQNMMAKDAEEGMGAFIGKRKPEWTGE